jgi:hypothetical protein
LTERLEVTFIFDFKRLNKEDILTPFDLEQGKTGFDKLTIEQWRKWRVNPVWWTSKQHL